MYLNMIVLAGFVARESVWKPKVRDRERRYMTFRLGCPEQRWNADRRAREEWVNYIEVYAPDTCFHGSRGPDNENPFHLMKGTWIAIEGRLVQQRWTAEEDGKPMARHLIICNRLDVLDHSLRGRLPACLVDGRIPTSPADEPGVEKPKRYRKELIQTGGPFKS